MTIEFELTNETLGRVVAVGDRSVPGLAVGVSAQLSQRPLAHPAGPFHAECAAWPHPSKVRRTSATCRSSSPATSDDGDAEAEGELTVDSVTGTVVLANGKTVRYQASPPSGAEGLYELTVSSAGELSGASAGGLAETGQISLGERGTGMPMLVDGKRLELSVASTRAGDLAPLRAGEVRLILSDGQLRGVAKGRPSNGGRSDFVIRSA